MVLLVYAMLVVAMYLIRLDLTKGEEVACTKGDTEEATQITERYHQCYVYVYIRSSSLILSYLGELDDETVIQTKMISF